MWPDSNLRTLELLDKARYFEAEGNPVTARWTKYFAHLLSERRPVANLVDDFAELFKTFQSEYRKGDESRGLLLEVIRGIVLAALRSKNIRARMSKLQPLFQEVAFNSKNIELIVKPFLPFQQRRDHKMQYYGMCVNYLFQAEGVFDVAVRIIYAMASIAKELPALLAELNEMRLGDVKQRLRDEVKIPADIFFLGWEDGRVRNAIAHLRFSYDDATQKMRFRDIATKHRGPYDRSFTIDEFSKLSFRLMDPWHLIQNLFFILRIQQLVFHRKLDPPPGKYLIFK